MISPRPAVTVGPPAKSLRIESRVRICHNRNSLGRSAWCPRSSHSCLRTDSHSRFQDWSHKPTTVPTGRSKNNSPPVILHARRIDYNKNASALIYVLLMYFSHALIGLDDADSNGANSSSMHAVARLDPSTFSFPRPFARHASRSTEGIAPRIRISLYDDENARCSGSSRLDLPSASSTCLHRSLPKKLRWGQAWHGRGMPRSGRDTDFGPKLLNL